MNKSTNVVIIAATVIVLILLFLWAGKGREAVAPVAETSQTSNETGGRPSIPEVSTPGGAAARVHLVVRLGIDIADVEVVSETKRDWRDACLGIGASDVLCAQVITPGYEVVMRARGTTYTYRTNATGSVVKSVN